MKNHVFRPLFVVIGLVGIVLIARYLLFRRISASGREGTCTAGTGRAMKGNGRP